jgi:hypothetical protein
MTINLYLVLGVSTCKFFLILRLYNGACTGFSALNELVELANEELEADSHGLLENPSNNNLASALVNAE